jgi:mRNA interferase HigB
MAMNVIGYQVINSSKRQHPDLGPSLDAWFDTTSRADWKSIVDVRKTYPHADAVGICTVFNVKGNKYRLITEIDYAKRVVQIKRVLTHAEYDKEKWKKDCGG